MRRLVLRIGPLATVVTLIAFAASGFAAGVPPPNVLKVALSVDIDYVDPALAYYVPSWQIEYATCAKLMNHPDQAAPAGSRVVPEVAAGLPTVSPDGKTYTFDLRGGFMFAPSGGPVTADSFKWAFDRLLSKQMSSPGQQFYRDIAGADEVIAGTASSVSGISVVDTDTISFTLEATCSDFLARLAMPFACPLPRSVLIDADGIDAPVPSAGPYYVESWTRNREIVIRENAAYTGSRQHNFDEIRYVIGWPSETIKLNIDAGEVDFGDLPPASHAELGTLYGPGSAEAAAGRQRYFVFPSGTVLYVAMNHERALFGDDPANGAGLDPRGNVKLKKAVNFAIDRAAMAAQRGAYEATATDQYLPAGMPGYRDEHIYPSQPDLAKARELAGWQPGDPVRNGVFYCSNRAPAPAICQIVQANLRQIGIELEIQEFPRAVQFTKTGTRGEPFDMTLDGWHQDYYDPNDFLFLFLRRGTRRPAARPSRSPWSTRRRAESPNLAPNVWQNPAEDVDGVDDDGNGFVDDVRGWDFVDEDADPADESGHGTHVAGTIGARGNEGVGVVGVNWNVGVMALRAGSDHGLADEDIIEAFAYACESGAKVITGLRRRARFVLGASTRLHPGVPVRTLRLCRRKREQRQRRFRHVPVQLRGGQHRLRRSVGLRRQPAGLVELRFGERGPGRAGRVDPELLGRPGALLRLVRRAGPHRLDHGGYRALVADLGIEPFAAEERRGVAGRAARRERILLVPADRTDRPAGLLPVRARVLDAERPGLVRRRDDRSLGRPDLEWRGRALELDWIDRRGVRAPRARADLDNRLGRGPDIGRTACRHGSRTVRPSEREGELAWRRALATATGARNRSRDRGGFALGCIEANCTCRGPTAGAGGRTPNARA